MLSYGLLFQRYVLQWQKLRQILRRKIWLLRQTSLKKNCLLLCRKLARKLNMLVKSVKSMVRSLWKCFRLRVFSEWVSVWLHAVSIYRLDQIVLLLVVAAVLWTVTEWQSWCILLHLRTFILLKAQNGGHTVFVGVAKVFGRSQLRALFPTLNLRKGHHAPGERISPNKFLPQR